MSEIPGAFKRFLAQKPLDFFVGIDSDGCEFDTMTIKHITCFGPMMVKDMGWQAVAEYALENRVFLDLKSKWRGYNRWDTFLMNHDLMEERLQGQEGAFVVPRATLIAEFFADARYKKSNEGIESFIRDKTSNNPQIGDYLDFVKNTFTDLRKHVPPTKEMWTKIDGLTQEHELAYLLRAFYWSFDVNRAIANMVHGIPPFHYAHKTLEALANTRNVDVIVVSATPGEALQREWAEHDIAKYAAVIAGQEYGGKGEHLALGNGGEVDKGKIIEQGSRYLNHRRLMIGDAFGDLQAAIKAKTLFYPIVAGQENLGGQVGNFGGWNGFLKTVLPKFLEGTYSGDYQIELIQRFFDSLPGTPNWINPKAHPDDIYVPNIPTLRVPRSTYEEVGKLKQKAIEFYRKAI